MSSKKRPRGGSEGPQRRPDGEGGRRSFGAHTDSRTKQPHSNSKNSHSHSAGKKAEREEPVFGQPAPFHFDKYKRGAANSTKSLTDVKLRGALERAETQGKAAVTAAARSEMLLTEEAGYLETEGMERTYRLKQADIAKAVDIGVSKKAVNLTLDTYGPYKLSYSRNGRYMLLGGAKGHVAVVDWNKFAVSAEFHVKESIHDVTFLHNSMMFAVAQSKCAYIYDHTGMELHALKNHVQPLALDFLPYHFLLASTGNAGFLKYQDVSTGALVAEHRTKLGACSVLRHNPWNAVECLGHSNGCVTMWTPNMSTPAVRMQCHRGPVSALAVDPGGRYCVTSGADARLKVWDIRKFRDEPVFNYFLPTPAQSLDVSQRGLVAVGYGSHVQVWGRDFALEKSQAGVHAPLEMPSSGGKKQAQQQQERRQQPAAAGDMVRPGHIRFSAGGEGGDDREEEEEEGGDGAGAGRDGGPGSSSSSSAPAEAQSRKQQQSQLLLRSFGSAVRKASAPYLRHELPGKTVVSVRFRPYDDVLAVGHSAGLASLLVPGAGEPNYDSREADPFQSKKGQREAEVRGLLDKLPSTSIALDPGSVGAADRAAPAIRAREAAEDAAAVAAAAPSSGKKERKGRSSSERRRMKKNANVVTEARLAMLEKNKARQDAAKAAEEAAAAAPGSAAPASALSRFFNRPAIGGGRGPGGGGR